MGERKQHKYKSNNKKTRQFYKEDVISGDIYDLLPAKHKEWFTETKGLTFDRLEAVAEPRRRFPRDHEAVFMEELHEERKYKAYNLRSLRNIINAANANGDILRIARSEFDDGALSMAGFDKIYTLGGNWYRIPTLEEFLTRYEADHGVPNEVRDDFWIDINEDQDDDGDGFNLEFEEEFDLEVPRQEGQ